MSISGPQAAFKESLSVRTSPWPPGRFYKLASDANFLPPTSTVSLFSPKLDCYDDGGNWETHIYLNKQIRAILACDSIKSGASMVTKPGFHWLSHTHAPWRAQESSSLPIVTGLCYQLHEFKPSNNGNHACLRVNNERKNVPHNHDTPDTP